MSPNDPQPQSLAVRIDDVCNRFEMAWRSGSPCIEEFVADWHGDERRALLEELVPLDLEYRGKRGEAGRLEDYAARFPELTGSSNETKDGWVIGSAVPPNPHAPCVVGDYEILSEIDRGGQAVVYRATDRTLGREVAVKVLKHGSQSGPAVRRFLDEARITAQLQHHPAIPPVHDLGTLPDGRPFLAMKLIEGCTLDKLLSDRPDPSADRSRFLAVFEQVCQAVAYAHAHKVIHRDLKPRNVMVGAFGEVQVMDWGLAKVLADSSRPLAAEAAPAEPVGTVITPLEPSDGSETQAGGRLGTPAFAPPEQAGGEIAKVDARADVFGLGAILAVILTGQPPYVGESFEAVGLMAVRGQLAGCLTRLDACGAEPGLVALCKRCLAFDPNDRPLDASAVADSVAGLRAQAEERARAAEEQARAAEEQQRKRRWQVAAAGATALALLAVVGGLVFVLSERTQAEERLKKTNNQLEATNSELVNERSRVRLALTVQVAERLESNLKQLEQVGQALALLAQEPAIDENHLALWMRKMLARDERIYGLTLALEPGNVFHNPHQQAATLGLLASPQGGPLSATAALFLPETTEYCLYVCREKPEISTKYLHPGYRYRQQRWFNEPLRCGQPRWSPAPSCDEGGAERTMVAYLVPIRRQGNVVGVATVDLDVDDFFGRNGPLGNWRDQIQPEQRQGTYGFVISHTATAWAPGQEIRRQQANLGQRGWNGEPGTGAFVNHPKYQFPLRIKDLPALPPDFAELAGRILRRDENGLLVEATGIGKATDAATGKWSTFLFARVSAAEWTFVMVIEEAGDATP